LIRRATTLCVELEGMKARFARNGGAEIAEPSRTGAAAVAPFAR
jgi:hypothetical protein